jgi:hypothetical protein
MHRLVDVPGGRRVSIRVRFPWPTRAATRWLVGRRKRVTVDVVRAGILFDFAAHIPSGG